MKRFWSVQAARDADEIWSFIAADSPDAADRVVARFHDALLTLSEQPRMGRRGRTARTREFVVSGTPYILVYAVHEEAVEVFRIIHGARDWPPKRRPSLKRR